MPCPAQLPPLLRYWDDTIKGRNSFESKEICFGIVFFGYSSSQKGYEYNLESQTFFVNRNVLFHESIFPFTNMSYAPLLNLSPLNIFDLDPIFFFLLYLCHQLLLLLILFHYISHQLSLVPLHHLMSLFLQFLLFPFVHVGPFAPHFGYMTILLILYPVSMPPFLLLHFLIYFLSLFIILLCVFCCFLLLHCRALEF